MSDQLAGEYDAVIFDNDGVLVEPTEQDVLVDAVQDAFQSFGVEIDRSLARHTIEDSLVPTEIAQKYGLDIEALWHYRELTAALAQQTSVRDGDKRVYDDVEALDRLTVPLGLVSNNQHATVEFLLAYYDLNHFETAYGRRPTLAGAANRKPNPHYIQQALADLGTNDALYVGDSEKDVLAAQNAGIDSVYLRREHTSGTTLSVTPTAEMHDLWSLVEQLTD